MFTKYKDVRVGRLDPEKGINEHFENVSCQGRIQKFFKIRGIKFRHILSVFFPAELI